jgi:shikimate kinase
LRPPLKGADPLAEVDEVLAARREAYETAADLKIETDGLSIDEVARRITKSQAPRGI